MRTPRPAARRGPLLVVLLLALGACGSGGAGPSDDPATVVVEEPSPEPTAPKPTAPKPDAPRYTTNDLAAALPSAAELPAGFAIDSQCPENPGDTCITDTGTVYASLGALDATWALIQVNLASHATAESAAAAKEADLNPTTRFNGAFEEPGAELEGGNFSPGERGTGTVSPVTIADWEGTQLAREYVLLDLSGDPMDEAPMIEVTLSLRRGLDAAEVRVVRRSGTVDAATAEAHELLDLVLTRLG